MKNKLKKRDPHIYGAAAHERSRHEAYWTPAWCVGALADVISPAGCVWEPAIGNGAIASELAACGVKVIGSDISGRYLKKKERSRYDFLKLDFLDEDLILSPWLCQHWVCAIVTNPPYGERGELADRFIERCINFLSTKGDFGITTVGLLLRADHDSAKTRKCYFGDCAHFAEKIVLTKRPYWGWPGKKEDTASPRKNFAWYVWSKFGRHDSGLPSLKYYP